MWVRLLVGVKIAGWMRESHTNDDSTAETTSASQLRPAYDVLFKFLLVGDSGVGKSSFVTQFLDHQFPSKYLGADLDFVRSLPTILSLASTDFRLDLTEN
jgi:septin family protein